MAKIKDLGISVIPMTMRPLEIGLGGALGPEIGKAPQYWACGGGTECEACACENASDPVQESTCNPSGRDDECKPTRPECPPPSRPPGQKALGFTSDAVLQLKRQLRTRIGKRELQH